MNMRKEDGEMGKTRKTEGRFPVPYMGNGGRGEGGMRSQTGYDQKLRVMVEDPADKAGTQAWRRRRIRMRDQVLYAHGGGSYVIRLAEKVYAFTSPGEGNSHFSIDPWSFLKFGYFTEADDVPELPDILRKIDTDRRHEKRHEPQYSDQEGPVTARMCRLCSKCLRQGCSPHAGCSRKRTGPALEQNSAIRSIPLRGDTGVTRS